MVGRRYDYRRSRVFTYSESKLGYRTWCLRRSDRVGEAYRQPHAVTGRKRGWTKGRRSRAGEYYRKSAWHGMARHGMGQWHGGGSAYLTGNTSLMSIHGMGPMPIFEAKYRIQIVTIGIHGWLISFLYRAYAPTTMLPSEQMANEISDSRRLPTNFTLEMQITPPAIITTLVRNCEKEKARLVGLCVRLKRMASEIRAVYLPLATAARWAFEGIERFRPCNNV